MKSAEDLHQLVPGDRVRLTVDATVAVSHPDLFVGDEYDIHPDDIVSFEILQESADD